MLAEIGFETLDALIDSAVPKSIRQQEPLGLAPGASEPEVLARLREIASRNVICTSLIGLGYHDTFTPPVIQRNVLENPGWYTAYTPYQPEISQGRLEVLLNYQTMICDLTGMDVANASLLDAGTAAAEAMTLLLRATPKGPRRFLVDSDCNPQAIDVVHTRAHYLDIEVVVADVTDGLESELAAGLFGVLVAYPGSSGAIPPLSQIVETCHAAGAKVAVSADPLALVLLRSPGELGADCVVGTTQRFGVPLGFGGPNAGFIAVREKAERNLPGRLVGVSVDSAGRQAFRLALQTREQHIRREKATSNICTAQVLLAVMAALYAQWHGPEGLQEIARRVQRRTEILAEGLRTAGMAVGPDRFFGTITVGVAGHARLLAGRARERRINLRIIDDDTLGISLDETTTPELVDTVLDVLGSEVRCADLEAVAPSVLDDSMLRSDPILTHPVFHDYRSETEMLRYLRRLADKDVGLDRSMIPLGSCTMKLNASAEMMPVSWPEFASLHPFAPLDQASGYLELISELEGMLCEITGYDAVSLQPNAGSQGEYAGLLAIRAWHESRGDGQRDVCLIPASAHGTNAASAAMAGMDVMVVACDESGNVDLGDLREKVDAAADRLSAVMITYPSTHGVYEEHVRELCDIVHEAGGQVYLDGANLNALVGLAQPGRFGADVSHLNLHKTFCIPHGGGGPGVGPVAVRSHLAPFLPNHPAVPDAGPATGIGPVADAPWGSAGILPISWAYISLMGAGGLVDATRVAVLNANYVAHRLRGHYPVLYTGEKGLVAHECILDVRPLTADTGVTVDDIAKRLIDYGFHAPTMSFPVAGTLMIEPTESESLGELDRFCEAMIAIRSEIDRLGAGEWPEDDNPLRCAPHTAEDVAADEWTHPYSRTLAAYPVEGLRSQKYWPPVGRVDNAWGDRHLFCTCPLPGEA